MRMLTGLLAILITFSPLSRAEVQPPPVRMTLESMSLRTRTGGPIGLRIKLHYNRQQLLEGNLLLKIFDGRRDSELLRTTCRYDGIVLHGSDANFDLLLPPLADAFDRGFDIEAWFETETERIPLSAGRIVRDLPDTFNIMSSDPSRRSTVLFSVVGRTDPRRISPSRNFLHDMLSPHVVLPEERQREVTWVPASLTGISLPEDPLQLCCSDLVLITDGGLTQLESAQLDALTTWTQAGGSLCLALTDQGLSSRHLEFLRQLFPNDAERLILTDDGRIELATDDVPFCAAYVGLGRCVLLPTGVHPESDLTDEDRSWIGRFLWKARGCRYPADGESFARVDREKQLPQERLSSSFDANSYSMGLNDLLVAQHSVFGQMCESVLIPSDVTMVPTSVIILLLSAYVLAVGPVDYLVLGFFRLRKYTWIVFPLVTLAFTLTMVAVAHHYLGAKESGKQLTVTDVVGDGTPVRSSVIDLEYVGSRRDEVTSHQGGLIASLQSEEINVTGRFPHDYSVSRRLEQWKPDLTRTFTLSPEPLPDLGIDWNETTLVTTRNGREQLRKRLTERAIEGCLSVSVLHGTSEHRLIDSPDPMLREFSAQEIQSMTYSGALPLRHTLRSTVEQGTRAPTNGLFRYVSQVSPGGAAAMEDMPVLDHSNPDQWLLMIVLETDDGFHLIRKLYCLPGSADRSALHEPFGSHRN